MARTTISDVRLILPSTTELTDGQIQASIDAATCVVDQIAAGCASSLTVECLKQVETYLSAHYAAATEFSLNTKSETDSCAESSVSYGWVLGVGIKGTPFGQMANTLSRGCLAALDSNVTGMFSIGCL